MQATGSAPTLTAAVDLALTTSHASRARARIAAADAAAFAPPLRAHYAPGADGTLTVTPGVRAFAGTHPLARGLVCLWKGRARYNLMLDADEPKAVEAILKGRKANSGKVRHAGWRESARPSPLRRARAGPETC